MKKKVTKVLRELNVSPALKGYEYIRTGIVMVLEDKKLLKSITGALYINIAKEHDETPARVERAIRHAIETSVFNADKEALAKYINTRFRKELYKPTNSEYIAAIVDYIEVFMD